MWTVSVIFLALGFVASTRGHPASGSIARLPEALSIAGAWTPQTLPDEDAFGNDPLTVEPPTSGNKSVASEAVKHETGEALSKTGVPAIGGLKGTLGFLVEPEKIQAEPERESLKPTVPPELWTEQTGWHPGRGAATDTMTSVVGLVEQEDTRSEPEPNSDLKMRMNASPVQHVGFTIERQRLELKPGKTPTATEQEGVSQEPEAGHRLEPRAASRTAIVQVHIPVPNLSPVIQRVHQASNNLQRDALNGITNVATHKPVINGRVHGGNAFWLLHRGKRWIKRLLTGFVLLFQLQYKGPSKLPKLLLRSFNEMWQYHLELGGSAA
ncbi:uncharacterized protein [Bemisia tabaci]|uniref:uncharacterized protein isoform X2 n=1 Tax=Bemisia tabaci TaxID=7038 RepID=UPI003B285F70